MNTLTWPPKAINQAMKTKDRTMRARIFNEAQALEQFPACANIKKLTNHVDPYRLPISAYWLYFTFDGAIRIVKIEGGKPRHECAY